MRSGARRVFLRVDAAGVHAVALAWHLRHESPEVQVVAQKADDEGCLSFVVMMKRGSSLSSKKMVSRRVKT